MHYAMIMAGGSGKRLWPLSRGNQPKQLVPLFDGRSLLELAYRRLDGLIDPWRRYICAGRQHRAAILSVLPGMESAHYLGEPEGRDTLNAVGFASAVIARQDPDAIMIVLTADHLIEPVNQFQICLEQGLKIAEQVPNALVTFGITPTHAATGFGYLELDEAMPPFDGAHRVGRYKEKPDEPTARQYLDAGPGKYLWNSGMFVWRAKAMLECIARYEPETHAGLMRIADHWGSVEQQTVIDEVYPQLKKISVDYAVMEPASRDPRVAVAALPMPLKWMDVGSWPAVKATGHPDAHGNVVMGGRGLLHDSRNVLAFSAEPNHVVAVVGSDNLIVVHTPGATLVCPADRAEEIKHLHDLLGQRHPDVL
ncbi:MAG: mannose-1-phosphate guanylyltransferase [Phycisphaeraceae bacterium]|nr:mannose-1-phosphate guanylyltransferase [Phycisphaeraceae bacterium]